MGNGRQENIEVEPESIGEPESLEDIYARKQRRYTLITLVAVMLAAVLVSVVAFIQGVLIRQVVNTTVALVTIICILVLYQSKEPIRWPTYIAVGFLHIVVTSGFITNGGVSFYSASTLPVVPMITALLLGQRAAVYSVIYVLFLTVTSGLLVMSGTHPPNMTQVEYQPIMAVLITDIAVICAFVGFYSLIETTKRSEEEVKIRTEKLENEIQGRLNAEKKARAASLAKSQFLAAISHELRTPLNSIIGFSQLLAKLELSDKGKVCTHQITESSSELLKKVNDLLEFTELFFDKAEVKMKPLVVEDLFAAIINAIEGKEKVNSNRLIFSYGAIKNHVIVTDMEKVNKILFNMIENALKFTEKGEIRVTAELRGSGRESQFFCEIRDTGLGLDECKIDELFDAFTQYDMSSSRVYEGIGLGLASSYNLTLLLGGSLEAKNNSDKGCTFYLRLPVKIEMDV